MYVYIYLDPLEPGNWAYLDKTFSHKPFYIGVGTRNARKVAHWRNSIYKYENKSHDYINPILYDRLLKLIKKNKSPIIQKVFELEEDEVYACEVAMISHFGRISNGGLLCNTGTGGKTQKIVIDLNVPIVKFNMSGDIVAEFDSIVDAEKSIKGVGKSAVKVQLRGITATAHGFIYKYKSEIGDITKLDVKAHMTKFKDCVTVRNRELHRYSMDGVFEATHPNHSHAAKFVGISTIRRSTSIRHKQGYLWSSIKYDAVDVSNKNYKGIIFSKLSKKTA